MNLPLHIARKYFFSVKKKAFINLISILAISIVTVATASIVVIISAMNGFTDYIKKYQGALEGDIKITAVQGKTFVLNPSQKKEIEEIEGVNFVTEVLEDNAFAVNFIRKDERKQKVIKLKGVTGNYYEQFDYEDFNGVQTLHVDKKPTALVGYKASEGLNLDSYNEMHERVFFKNKHIQLLYPNREGKDRIKNLNDHMVMAVAEFVQVDYEDYIIVPMEIATELFGYDKERTSIEIECDDDRLDIVQSKIKAITGEGFYVKNRDEQNAVLLKAIKLEKLIVFIILIIVLGIASINIFFSLSMLEIEKRKDIAVLFAVGVNRKLIKRTFIYVGGIVASIGGILGFFFGSLLCWLQIEYGLVQVGNGEPYPIKVQIWDNVFIALAIISITILFSIRPAIKASKVQFDQGL